MILLPFGMAIHYLVCVLRMQQQCGHTCAADALSHEKSHGSESNWGTRIRTATCASSSPRNCSKYTIPSSPRGPWGLGLGPTLASRNY